MHADGSDHLVVGDPAPRLAVIVERKAVAGAGLVHSVMAVWPLCGGLRRANGVCLRGHSHLVLVAGKIFPILVDLNVPLKQKD